ncbi:hypothetical protein A2U01_0065237, partial [Trifolium medium]|nr:hypothetical protein [Trifolium medium]
ACLVVCYEFITCVDEFWGGFALNPPPNALFYVLVARWRQMAPGAVLAVAGRGGGDMVASRRQFWCFILTCIATCKTLNSTVR